MYYIIIHTYKVRKNFMIITKKYLKTREEDLKFYHKSLEDKINTSVDLNFRNLKVFTKSTHFESHY